MSFIELAIKNNNLNYIEHAFYTMKTDPEIIVGLAGKHGNIRCISFIASYYKRIPKKRWIYKNFYMEFDFMTTGFLQACYYGKNYTASILVNHYGANDYDLGLIEVYRAYIDSGKTVFHHRIFDLLSQKCYDWSTIIKFLIQNNETNIVQYLSDIDKNYNLYLGYSIEYKNVELMNFFIKEKDICLKTAIKMATVLNVKLPLY